MIPRQSFLRRVGRVARYLLLAVSLATVACVHQFVRTEVRSVETPSGARVDIIQSPVKVHLVDGSTVVFRRGANVSFDRITGVGQHYLLLSDSAPPAQPVRVLMDSVVGVEAFDQKTLAVPTLVTSLAATAAGVVGLAFASYAIFGSCPTIYADTGGRPVLEAEGFSHAISPLMEQRDLDALSVRPGADGVLRLELRNEALETHYINQLSVVAVRHARGALVVPDQGGLPVVVGDFASVTGARDRAGRDVRAVLAKRDGSVYATPPAVMSAAREGDLDDWIDLNVAGLSAGDSIAVVLRMRNSLLNTVLLYEGMLGGRDAPDWLANDMQQFGRVIELARWYRRTMGMRLTVDGVPLRQGASFEGHARLGDVGPIAFRSVAVVLPRPASDDGTAHIRLRFVADNWRIDEVRVAGRVTRSPATVLAVDSVIVPTPAIGAGPVLDTAAVPALAAPDGRYLETRPGQRMTLVFHPDTASAPAADSTATYLVAWKGWYNEWIRASWLATPSRTAPFVAGDAAVLTALRRWQERQAVFEREFYSSTIPVR